jgi:aminoglycoside phosphotransferase (APT) family kinase protein
VTDSKGEAVGDLYELDSMMQWLHANVVADPPKLTLMHGDYKTDNIVCCA